MLYTLTHLELDIRQLKNKCIIRLENPLNVDKTLKDLYLEMAYFYRLNNDERLQINVSNDKVLDSKIKGERGVISILQGYEIFTSNTSSFELSPPLHESWGEGICFFLRNIIFVVILVEDKLNYIQNRLVIVDLAHSKQFKYEERLQFIYNLAARVRNSQQPNNGVLFQNYDVDYIAKFIIPDSEICLNGSDKTVNLKYLRLGTMVDSNGITYKIIPQNTINLTPGSIYSCKIDFHLQRVNSINGLRLDMFYADTRKTIVKNTIDKK